MKKLFEIGGYIAALVLIAFGVTALVLGIASRGEIRDSLAAERITGTPDMTPAAIEKEVEEAGITVTDLPTQAVAGEAIDTGAEAKTFAGYMRVHALLATGGRVYAEMGRYLTEDGEETNDPAAAAKNEQGRPVPNQARDIWVTETALATALNVSYFGEQVSSFSIIVAVALIIAGIGFGILAFSAFRWIPARETARSEVKPRAPAEEDQR
jgi:hypothetical protein